MYVKCRVEVQTSSGEDGQLLLSFPALALHPDNHIWIVRDKKLQRVDVEVVDRMETMLDGIANKIVIVKTENDVLQPGDTIVVSPLSQPTIGAPVILKQEAATSKISAEVSEKSSSDSVTERTSLN